MEYDEDHDNINTLKKRIQDRFPERYHDASYFYCKLKLYRPVKRLNYEEEFRLKDGELLHPHLAITSDPLFPDSKDPNVDIVVSITSRKRMYFERERGESDLLRSVKLWLMNRQPQITLPYVLENVPCQSLQRLWTEWT